MKKHLSTILLVIIFLTGLSLLLYPSVSDYYNSFHQTRAIADYEHVMESLSEEDYSLLWEAAIEYNRRGAQNGGFFHDSDEYENLLDVSGTGMMGHIEIPSIRVSLPIYHNTEDSVLQFAVGHLNWSSLPVGGENTHCLLSGHRGLPSAKLFTNLDRLTEGDIFKLYILDSVLTYQVDQISVVEPDDADTLGIIPGGDFCTLITCTPYGINTQRLLVRGQRIATTENIHTSADAIQIEPLLVAPIAAVPVLLVLIIFVMIKYRRRR